MNKRSYELIDYANKLFDKVRSSNPTGWQSEEIFIDWIGNRWATNMFPHIPKSAQSVKIPIEGDGIRAGKLEWLAFGIALSILTKSQSTKSVLLELGSSQAPWCLSWIRAMEKITTEIEVVTVGVEAGLQPGQIENFWTLQSLPGKITRDQISLKDCIFYQHYLSPNRMMKFMILNRAVTYKDVPHVYFPSIDITKDNGASLSTFDRAVDYRGVKVEHKKIQAISFAKLVSIFEKIDFMHLDLQGEELNIVRYFVNHKMSRKCKVLLVGTHSKRSHFFWRLILICKGFDIYGSNPPLIIDGILIEDGEIVAVSRHAVNYLHFSE